MWRNIDQYPARPVAHDLSGQVVLQGQRETIVHVHLDGHEQELAHL